jgi:hypothetical protein
VLVCFCGYVRVDWCVCACGWMHVWMCEWFVRAYADMCVAVCADACVWVGVRRWVGVDGCVWMGVRDGCVCMRVCGCVCAGGCV